MPAQVGWRGFRPSVPDEPNRKRFWKGNAARRAEKLTSIRHRQPRSTAHDLDTHERSSRRIGAPESSSESPM